MIRWIVALERPSSAGVRWEAAPGQTNGTVTLTLPAAVTFDVVSLQEAVGISHRIGGLTCLPRQNGTLNDVVETYILFPLGTLL